VAGTSLLATGAVGGVVGYASYDLEFRKSVEELVPGSEDVLDILLGSKAAPEALPEVESKLKTITVSEPLPEVVEEKAPSIEVVEEKAPSIEVVEEPAVEAVEQKEEEKVVEVEQTIPETEAEIIKDVEVETAPTVEEQATPETEAETIKVDEPTAAVEVEAVQADEPVEETETQEVSDPKQMEAEIAAPISSAIHLENSSLTEDLEDLCAKMKAATEEAVTLNQASSEAINNHMKVMQKVLEADLTTRNEAAWNEVFEAATTKSKTSRLAESKSKEARNYITLALDLIRAGRSNKVTCANPALSVAEQAAEEALNNIDQAETNIQTVQSEAKILEEYRDIVEEGRQQFHQEMASLMPDVKLGEKGSQLSEDELNLFITHAYRKVLHLQQELAKQQTLEQQRFKQAVDKQELETRMAAEQKIESELSRQRLDMETDHQVRIKTVREDMEKELRDQLRRQAAAHSDHLADVLAVQEMEMTRKHDHVMEEKVSSLSVQAETSLASATGAVEGLRSAIEARAEDDKAALEAEKLWLACTTLSQAVKEGTADAATWEERAKPLAKIVKDVKSASGADDKFVSTVLNSIPSVALERGVYTEDSLKERFVKVEKLAKKVALIGDDGGSLFKFGLSYLQSLLLVNTTERTPSLADVELDTEQLSTQELVCQARFSIDRGNFVQALQFMNQLKGEPRRVASDWLKETQLLLETQLAVDALLAHAACVGVEALPEP